MLHDRNILLVTIGLLVANWITGVAALYQAHISSISAKAAQSAAETASNTLGMLATNSDQSSSQTEAATGHLSRVAGAMEGSLDQARAAMEASEGQSSKALNASIDQNRLDQRAWLGFVESTNISFKGGRKPYDHALVHQYGKDTSH